MTAQIPLPGTDHMVWSEVALRAPGFTIELLETLAAPRLVAAAADALEGAADAVKRYEAVFAEERAAQRERLRRIAADPRFAEAILWQNPGAYRLAVRSFAREAGRDDKRARQRELLVASYLQRYCAKNDTIGFFGPVGWARLATSGPLIDHQPGRDLVRDLVVRFEVWAVDELARQASMRVATLEDVPARLIPYVTFDGDTLVVPGGARIPLEPWQAVVLRGCDGWQVPLDLASRALPEVGPDTALQETCAFLDRAASMRLVTWRFEASPRLEPEKDLLRQVERLEADHERESLVGSIQRVVAARDRLIAAAGDPVRLDAAMEDLEATFEQETSGTRAMRGAGRAYAGRTVTYVDARRDAETTFGPELLRTIGPALGLVLDAAAWHVDDLFSRFEAELDRVVAPLWSENGEVPLPLVHEELERRYGVDSKVTMFRDAAEDLHARWRRAIGQAAGMGSAPTVQLAADDLRDAFAREFPRSSPRSVLARQFSPDLILSSPSAAAANRGDFEVVLGELHVVNTLATSLFYDQHPNPEVLTALHEMDVSGDYVVAAAPKSMTGRRTSGALTSVREWRYAVAPEPIDHPSDRTFRMGDARVVRCARGISVVLGDGRVFAAPDFLASLLMFRSGGTFSPWESAAFRPRIRVDRLVISRATWQFSAASAAFAASREASTRFLEAQRFVSSAGLPRRCFLRTASERKPVHVDWHSPVLVELAAKMIRAEREAGGLVTISEMLPEPESTWLTDARGQRYTSELRLVTVRPAGP